MRPLQMLHLIPNLFLAPIAAAIQFPELARVLAWVRNSIVLGFPALRWLRSPFASPLPANGLLLLKCGPRFQPPTAGQVPVVALVRNQLPPQEPDQVPQ